MERLERRLRDARMPALVAVVGCAASVALWSSIVDARRERLLAATDEIAAELRESVVHELSRSRSVLRELVARSPRDRAPRDIEAWQRDAGLIVAATPGLLALERTATPPATARVERPAEPRGAAAPATYELALPLPPPDGSRAAEWVVARFDARAQLADVIADHAPYYAIEVRTPDERLFARGLEERSEEASWWSATATVRAPDGGAWQLVLSPTKALATLRLRPLPEYLLAACIGLALLLGMLLLEWRRATRQARFLALANRSLEDEQRGLARLNEQLEARVTERTEALEDAIAELEAFNSSVSHDLRSPLGAIRNFTAILDEDYAGERLDEGGRALLARIDRSAARANALLEGLLALSRAGRAELDHRDVDMTALARDAFAQVRTADEDGDVELVLEPLPPAHGDAALLGGVFANLFSNALKYSRGVEKRRVVVSGRIEDDECIYEIADNGCGFDMRFAPKLFKVFERLHASDAVEGTGVGLATVERVVRRHRGRVWAWGAVGEGARFSFALPRKEPVQDD